MTNNTPIFLYSMVPVEKTAFKHFFEAGLVKSLLERPGELRYAGWDLATRSEARIVKGQYLEVRSAERKLIQLYEDGSLLVKVLANQEFLSWGASEESFLQFPCLNTLAVVEFSLNFCLLCAGLAKHLDPQSQHIELGVEVRNAIIGEQPLRLIPSALSTYGFGQDRPYLAPESKMKRQISTPIEELETRADVVAYSLLRQIFLWFGSGATIPYSSSKDQVTFIDADKIKTARA